jgi:hypothetical protein
MIKYFFDNINIEAFPALHIDKHLLVAHALCHNKHLVKHEMRAAGYSNSSLTHFTEKFRIATPCSKVSTVRRRLCDPTTWVIKRARFNLYNLQAVNVSTTPRSPLSPRL